MLPILAEEAFCPVAERLVSENPQDHLWLFAYGSLLWKAEIETAERRKAMAHGLARACGHWGSGADYLFNTVSHLEALGIHDAGLWALQDRVARKIEALYPAPLLVS